ncbi:hypothetical protein M0811_14256 [Anaeramoeba ignava]|uniref:Uncharacterized protein n=1 Tax=Anaeramoeba ignava TaxID=1746090 RepID=A0A9Q0RHM7_ANAIG|nr:hypothetical protein M0811_14256 [Anaeramoeba ignava]
MAKQNIKTNSKKKISIKNEKIEKISTGNKIISILTNEKKEMFMELEKNGFGQLGNNLNDQKQAILMMKDVSKVFTGNSSSHVFILNSKRVVWMGIIAMVNLD